MKNLSTRVIALVAVAALALLGLAVLAVVQGRYDTLLVGVIAGAAVGLVLVNGRTQAVQLKKLAAKVDKLAGLADGIRRLEQTYTAPARLLDGSPERQIAETAARFDWLARRQGEQAEQLDGFLTSLEATISRHHQDLLAKLAADPTTSAAEATPGTAGSQS